ncbi:CDP-diacylglycerol--glycerol-3-phosphate 3-phosphatidyltransferase [Serratia symbiotica]|nr:CDP-diacylglycerol--glycerol-3-phosphate 3-phosphatidyltransferase [Serratia symbiotica]
MPLNIPTLITFFRVILIPFFVIVFYLPFSWAPVVCSIIFVLAAITDWIDGFLARLWKQTTKFGAFLDPMADKIMVIVALVLIVDYYHHWLITIPSAIMIAREIIISSLREWMSEIGKRNNVSVSWIGKIKTVLQMLSLIGLLWRPERYIEFIGFFLLYISTILTFWSMFKYLKAAQNDLI